MSDTAAVLPARTDRTTGVALVSLATIAWSLSGVFTRLLTTDVVTAIAWRSFFGGAFLLLPYIAVNRGRSLRNLALTGKAELAAVLCQIICQICTVGGLYFTSVANVTVIYATSPYLAAILAWRILGERILPRTLVAGAASFAGVLVIVAGSLGGGHILGDLFALGMTTSFALLIVIPKAQPNLPMMPVTILSAFATMAIFAPFGAASAMGWHNWTVLAGFGLTNFTIALFLFLAGARRIAAAEAALIGTLEIVMAPLWVWLLFAERPAPSTLIGGAIVLAVILWHTLLDFRRPAAA